MTNKELKEYVRYFVEVFPTTSDNCVFMTEAKEEYVYDACGIRFSLVLANDSGAILSRKQEWRINYIFTPECFEISRVVNRKQAENDLALLKVALS